MTRGSHTSAWPAHPPDRAGDTGRAGFSDFTVVFTVRHGILDCMKRVLRTKRPYIEYPCTWTYKLFGRDRDAIRCAVGQIAAGRQYTMELSRSSRNERYHCMNLDLRVLSDEDRCGLSDALGAHADILLVL